MSELELTDTQLKLLEVVKGTRRPSRFKVLSAGRHLRLGWNLRRIDPEMAVFRAITAEEESVAALFGALKERGYTHAGKLNPRRHDHKAAVHPFFLAIEHALADAQIMALHPTLALRETSRGVRIVLRFHLTLPDGGPVVVEPIPPLHGEFSADGVQCDFSQGVAVLADRAQARTILAHIRNLANERNQLLYASSSGVPAITGLKDSYFVDMRDRIFRNIIVYLLISQEPSKQAFVQHSLNNFLAMLGNLPSDAADSFST